MTRAGLSAISLLTLLVAGCGGGGGGAPGPSAPPPPAPPPPPPPVQQGPTDPAVALARPISPSLLCGNGSSKRAAALTEDRFVANAAGVGINHSHFVEPNIWTAEAGSRDAVMRLSAVAATETNGDCWPELIFTSGATDIGQLILYENQGNGGFVQSLNSVAASANPVAGVGVADLDGDYRSDLVLGNLLAGDTTSYLRRADGGLDLLQSIAMSRSTFGFAFGDYSGDEWIDTYAAHWHSGPPAADAPALLRNQGSVVGEADGSFVPADSAAGTTDASVGHDSNLAPGFVDLDADGDMDLLIASDLGTSAIALNSGVATYAVVDANDSPLSDQNAAGQAIADFDNDGSWDWFVASVYGPGDGRDWPWGTEGNKLYWGSDTYPFLNIADPAAGIADADWPWGVCAEDFNNDGLVDLFVENGFGYTPSGVSHASLADRQYTRPRLFINLGNRTFAEESVARGIVDNTNGRGVACLDYDRDGDIDIAVAQNSGSAVFYENRHSASDGNAFVSIRLLSAAPNTHALGAIVTVEAGGVVQMRQVGANSNFQGQSAIDLHFGLGSAMIVNAISVRWSDGTIEAYSSMPANRFLTLLDPRIVPYADVARLSRIDDAIAAATGYVSVPAELTDDVLLGLTWMERMHGLSLPYSPADELVAREQNYVNQGEDDLARQINYWRRSYDPTHAISQAVYDSLQGFDRLSFAGVYCHQYAIGDSTVQTLRSYSASPQAYDTTHALLALLWAIDNDCPLPPTYDSQILTDAIESTFTIAEDAGSAVLNDLRIEAMAILAATGRHDLIQPHWVDQLLDAQLANGAWKGDPSDLDANPHTTGLALWLCLLLAEEAKVLTGFVAQSWDQY